MSGKLRHPGDLSAPLTPADPTLAAQAGRTAASLANQCGSLPAVTGITDSNRPLR
jgi:hypothetical protein